jgi:4-amino-4-deoxy-L-arabinose transferase-like glycosyltransferase
VVIGFALRLGLATALGLTVPPKPWSDQQEYDTYAWNLAQGRGYRGMSPDVADQDHLTAYRPPGPSLLMAGVYLAVGHRYDAVRVVHCLLGAASVWLTYRVGRRAFGEPVGLLAAAGYAVFPLAVYQSIDLLSEPLGVFLFLLFLDAALAFATRPTWPAAAGTGVVLGLALLTRANFVIMLPLFAVWAGWQFRSSGRDLLRSAAILGVASLVLTPWAIRNYAVFGTFIPFGTTAGSALLQGNNPLVVSDPRLFGYSEWDTLLGATYREAAEAGRIAFDPETAAELDRWADELRSAGDEVERDRRAKEIAVRWLKENPDLWAFLAWQKFARSWTPWLEHNPSATRRVLYLATWGPVLALFAVAFVPTLVGSLRAGSPAWLLHLAVLHFALNTVIFFANIRYRAPIDPVCFVLAAWAVTRVLNWVRGRPSLPAGSTDPTAEPVPSRLQP